MGRAGLIPRQANDDNSKSQNGKAVLLSLRCRFFVGAPPYRRS